MQLFFTWTMIILIFLCLPAHAQKPKSSDLKTGNTQLSLQLENTDIRELIRWAADHVEKNIIIHPDVKGKVTVLSGSPISDGDAYQVFLSILQVHGYAVVETFDSLKILPSAIATKQYAPVTLSNLAATKNDIVAHVLRLKHIRVTDAEKLLKPLLTNSALIVAVPDSDLLVIADQAINLSRALTLIDDIDQPNPTEIRVVDLIYAPADAVADSIRKLFPVEFASNKRLSLMADKRTNTLLMSGPPLVLNELNALALRLDTPSDNDLRTQIITIDYLKASELAAPLKNIAEQYTRDKDPKSTVIIDVNDAKNALIITATEAVIRPLMRTIKELDTPRSQVLVEAIIVEINTDKVFNLGVEWKGNFPGDGIVVGNATVSNLSTPQSPQLGGGFSLGYYRGDQFWLLVRALAGDTDSNLLSTPNIIALDNESAEILVGENVPFVTGSSTSASSPTSNPFQTIERQDIGISLKVTPHINNDETVTLEISQTVEQIAPTSSTATADIVTSKRQIQTTVLLRDDEVLVLGGLIRDDVTETKSKTPILGDIPLLGHLFRSTSVTKNKRNLMVFIHTRILHRTADTNQQTRRYIDHMRKLNSLNATQDQFLLPARSEEE